jgi:polar amino acid transport system substrate-binding protein
MLIPIIPLLLLALTSTLLQAQPDSPTAANTTPRLVIAYETNHNPPRALGSGTSINWEKPGLTLELLEKVKKALGIEIEYKRMPWKRGLYLLERSEIDGLFHASYKPEREQLGEYPQHDGRPDESRAIFIQSYALYKLKGSSPEYDGQSIRHLDGPIGVVSGYSIESQLKSQGYDISAAHSMQSNFDRLNKGRIVAFAMLENMADDFLQRNRDLYASIEKVTPVLQARAYYLLLSKRMKQSHPELSESIWNAVRDINQSASFQNLANHY